MEIIKSHMSPKTLLADLKEAGLSLEQIAVYMGEYLGGAHPSVQTLHRWKAGTSVPSRTYSIALARLHKARTMTGEEE
jgi:transcriptional regulator with XRE-family HTH domain